MTDDTEVHPLADLMPSDPLMIAPWLGCLEWAMSRTDFLEAFHEDTGNQWKRTPAKSPLERMIDEATGANLAYLRAFIQWHNENLWGDLDLVAGEGGE